MPKNLVSASQNVFVRGDGSFDAIPAAAVGGGPTGPAGGDLSGTYPNPQVAGVGGTAFSLPVSTANGGTGSASRNFEGLLTPTSVQTSGYSANPGDFVMCDTTSAGFTVTLPTAPANLTVVGVKMVTKGGTNTVTYQTGGSDVFNKAGGSTSGTLTLASQGIAWQYASGPAIWYVLGDDLPLSQLDTRYLQSANNLSDLAARQTALNNLAGAVTSGDYLRGSGSNVAMSAIQAADLPGATTGTQGAVILDGTAGDIQPPGQSAAAGSKGQAADAKHIHPPGSSFLCTPTQFAPAAQKIFTTTSQSFVPVTPAATTVAAGSNGGEISQVASWSSPSAGVLDVATTTGWATSGTVTVATSTTTATVTYTGIAVGQLTGCAYVSGSATGTVSTGGAVTLASSVANTGSFTAPPSGSVLVTASFVASIGTNGDQAAFGLCAHATTTPMLGFIAEINLGSAIFPFSSIPFLVTSLTPGTSYNFDLMWCVLSAQTGSIYAFGQTGTSPTLGSSGEGSAITMTVQAV